MEELFRYLSMLAPLPDELQAALVARTSLESFRKNRALLTVGEVCLWIGFVEQGLVKVSYDMPGGDERIVQFAKTGDIVFGVGSFTTGLPSKMSVVPVTDSAIRRIRKTELEQVCSRFPVFHVHLRKIIEIQRQLLEDHYLLFTLPPRDRYMGLLKDISWILTDRRIKDYMLAAYLGVDRATFSRFRNRK